MAMLSPPPIPKSYRRFSLSGKPAAATSHLPFTRLIAQPLRRDVVSIRECIRRTGDRDIHGSFAKMDQKTAATTNSIPAEKEGGGDLSNGRILLPDVVVIRPRNVYRGRRWNVPDMMTAGVVVFMHLLCLFAPFTFNPTAFLLATGLYFVTGLLGITLSFHRNLSHRSFKLPKWLEYFCAYCGVHALQLPSLHNRWEGYKGEGIIGKKPIFSVRRSSIIGRSSVTVEVYGEDNKTVDEYHIEGSFKQRCCTFLDSENETLAEIRRKVDASMNIVLGKDVFSLFVKAGFDGGTCHGNSVDS